MISSLGFVRRWPWCVAALYGALLAVGCDDGAPGTLAVKYQLGPADSSSCAQFDIKRLFAQLGDSGPQSDAVCGADLVISEIKSGSYDLRVQAFDSSDIAVMDNSINKDRVAVQSGAQVQFTARLSAVPAILYIRWAIKLNGFPVQCGTSGAKTDRFTLIAWAGADQLLKQTFDCDKPADSGSYLLVPDPDRSVKGASLTEVTVQPYERSGLAIGELVRFQFGKNPGPGRELFFTVDCNDNICKAAGEPPFTARQ